MEGGGTEEDESERVRVRKREQGRKEENCALQPAARIRRAAHPSESFSKQDPGQAGQVAPLALG